MKSKIHYSEENIIFYSTNESLCKNILKIIIAIWAITNNELSLLTNAPIAFELAIVLRQREMDERTINIMNK